MTRPLRRLYRVAADAAGGYGRHAGSEFAAAISYRVLFSLVPFLALLVSILELVLSDSARQQVVDWLFGVVPGTEVQASVERALAGSGPAASLVGLVSLVTLLWAASAMMGTVRTALRVIWDAEDGRGYVRGKLLDALLVAVAGALVVSAFGLSLVTQVAVEAGSDLAKGLGWSGEGRALGGVAQLACVLLVSFVAFLLVYRIVPPVHLPVADLWPAALFAAVAFQLVMAGFSFYLAHIAGYSAVYGPLGALLGFLALVYVLAAVFLFGPSSCGRVRDSDCAAASAERRSPRRAVGRTWRTGRGRLWRERLTAPCRPTSVRG